MEIDDSESAPPLVDTETTQKEVGHGNRVRVPITIVTGQFEPLDVELSADAFSIFRISGRR